MNNITRRSVLIAAVCCLIIAVTLSGCFFERGYLDDIHIPLETQEGEVIIREWRFLLGSGAEIYYKVYGKEVLLGQLSGGDDGFCPFQEGLYSVSVEENKLTIEWDRRLGNSLDKETFEIPAASTVKQSVQRQRLVNAMIALVCIGIPVVIIPVVIVIVRKRRKSS